MDSEHSRGPKVQAYEWLPFGAIKPAGWMRNQMQKDLENGFLGHLDELVPDLILKDDIYGADRLTRKVLKKDLGLLARGSEWEAQTLWWNSETQSNWRDGFVRTALLLDHPGSLARAHDYIEHILASQDKDGYLGIYAPDLRFRFTGENGELWAQASLFRVLLGWCEATSDHRTLHAVRRAVAVTMSAYPIHRSHPFEVKNDTCGLGHGLVFIDILDRLSQLTGIKRYPAYANWLFQEYSHQPLSQDDIQLTNLLDPGYRFKAHGVHTYEQIRSLLIATYAADSPQMDRALDASLAKLEACLTPSGGPIGDEFIGGRLAHAGETGYEYCSIHELLDTYTHLLQKTGNTGWADRAEWLFFNAGQGARHPTASAIAYLKTDNSHSMTGTLHPGDTVDPKNPQNRYKYSPAHQDIAVCCVPNAGRLFPYYVKAMWLRGPNGLTAMLFGASEVRAEVHGARVKIVQETGYPFSQEITFTLHVSRPVAFELAVRRPAWATGFKVTGEAAWREKDGRILFQKTWRGGERIEIRFLSRGTLTAFRKDEFTYRCGPLLYCLPLDGREEIGREYPLAGFHDRYYFPADRPGLELQAMEGQLIQVEARPFDPEDPWGSSPFLRCGLYAPAESGMKTVHLVPLGASILRQVTFSRHLS